MAQPSRSRTSSTSSFAFPRTSSPTKTPDPTASVPKSKAVKRAPVRNQNNIHGGPVAVQLVAAPQHGPAPLRLPVPLADCPSLRRNTPNRASIGLQQLDPGCRAIRPGLCPFRCPCPRFHHPRTIRTIPRAAGTNAQIPSVYSAFAGIFNRKHAPQYS